MGRSPGGGKGHPLQSCGLEKCMDSGPWGRREPDTTGKPSPSLTHRYSHRPGVLSRLPRADRTARWHSLFRKDTACTLHLSEDPTALRTSEHGSHVAHVPAPSSPSASADLHQGSDWGRLQSRPQAPMFSELSENTQGAPVYTLLQDTPRAVLPAHLDPTVLFS